MKKLEIKHLAPYLPYELKVQYQGITNLKELSEHNKKEPKGFNVLDEDYISWENSAPEEIIGTRISIIKRIHFYKTHIRLYVGKRHGYLKLVGFYDIKPILRPLSDLTKEIEHNGEKFVPLKRITKEYYDPDNETIFDNENLFKIVDNKYCYPSNNKRTSHWWLSYNEESISFDNQEVESVLPQYGLLQKLFEYHFDVFGLTEHGLAININTLEI